MYRVIVLIIFAAMLAPAGALGQQAAMKGGLSSARKDIGGTDQKFKKIYMESKYGPAQLEKKFNEWEGLMRKLFIRQR